MKPAREITDPHGIAFLAATKGVPAYTVAHVLWSLTPGTDWRGCTKGHMAAEYAEAKNGKPYARRWLASLNLDTLRRRCLAKIAGDSNWRRL